MFYSLVLLFCISSVRLGQGHLSSVGQCWDLVPISSHSSAAYFPLMSEGPWPVLQIDQSKSQPVCQVPRWVLQAT